MWTRLLLIAAFAIALVGPSPFHGARELAMLAKERIMEWTVFGRNARQTIDAIKAELRKARLREIAKR